MEELLRLEDRFALPFADPAELEKLEEEAAKAQKMLEEGSGEGSAFLGWRDLPVSFDREEYQRIKKCAEKITADSEVLLVIGIGGSYLGARAAIEFLTHSFEPEMHASGRNRKTPEICFAGQTVSSDYMADMTEYLEGKDWSINVISKSGTTTEPGVAFRIFRKLLTEKYGKEEAARRIYVTTDRQKGALKSLANEEGYETFVVPDNIGGRYSVLSAVGLLPIAAAGIDTDELLRGAAEMREAAQRTDISRNAPVRYAIYRNLFYRQGKKLEILAAEGPRVRYLGQWWVQLFAESEGKDGKGIFPACVEYSTDLHSVGQYIQDGERFLMETVLNIREPARNLCVPGGDSLDGLDYLEGRKLGDISQKMIDGTVLAHTDGGVPVLRLELERRDARSLGQIFYFFMYACAVSGYLLRVNPFNQPGVEAYKKNMFALLGRPGYEQQTEELAKRLS